MNQQRNGKVRQLFDAALDMDDAERMRFLERECASDIGLKEHVLQLLAAANTPDEALAGSPWQPRDHELTQDDETANLFGGPRPAAPIRAESSQGNRSSTHGLPARGTRIAQYEIIRELGRGGMGTVYLARDTKLARLVAIKFLQTADRGRTARFLQEAQATARFNHENIVVIHDCGEYQQQPYMVLEYLRGSTLKALMKAGPRMPPHRAIALMVPVVRALLVAHQHNIVHRDLKPDNIFITNAGTVKVLDFGIAKLMEDRAPSAADNKEAAPAPQALKEASRLESDLVTRQPTQCGAMIGTLAYMSPEQWRGTDIDHLTDLWALGIMLYQMLAGKHPLEPLYGYGLRVIANMDEPMPAAWTAASDIPSELADLIDHCLVKEKSRRMPSAAELLRVLEPLDHRRHLRRDWNAERSPYAGLSAFQESDSDCFFGRSRDIATAVARLRDAPLVAVAGPSGVGKSSFVRAGVVPALKESGQDWESLVMRPGRDPMTALAHAVMSMLEASSSTTNRRERGSDSLIDDLSQQGQVLERLRREPGFLGMVLRARARRHNRRILLFVDQFEELYTLIDDADERLTFTACLAGVADDAIAPLRVMVSIRSDFLDRAAEDAHFATEMTRGLILLRPPDRAGLREALSQPLTLVDYSFESAEIVDSILEELENVPGALPLMQFAVTQLWQERDSDNKLLTEQSYRDIGGIIGALASHADAVLADLAPKDQRLVPSIFVHLVTAERTRAIVAVDELCQLGEEPDDIGRLIDHLVKARLLVVAADDAGTSAIVASVEIVHESLIHSWPMLRLWLDENADNAKLMDQLRTIAGQWDARGRPGGLLWRGEALAEAIRWRRRYRGNLPDVQNAFLQAGQALDQRTTRRRRWAVVSIIVTLALLCAAAAVALVLVGNAEREARAQAHLARKAEDVARQSEAKALKSEQKALASEKQAKDNLRQLQQEIGARERAEANVAVAERQVTASKQELWDKDQQLEDALAQVEKVREKANQAAQQAEAEAARASRAERAEAGLREELEEELKRAQQRVEKLQKQLGSPRANEL